MGMAVGGSGSAGGRRGRRRARGGVMSEMNMTPFIDVMLVLLIIFMVSAPMMTVGVPLEMPESRAKALEGQVKPITVSIDAQGRVFIQDSEVKLEELIPKLQAIAKNGVDERIQVRGDKAADYGTVNKVIGLLSEGGFTKLGLMSLQAPGR